MTVLALEFNRRLGDDVKISYSYNNDDVRYRVILLLFIGHRR